MQVQRKIAVIMFSDIVGYTVLQSKDEQKARHILYKNRHTLKPLSRQFNGKWHKEIESRTVLSFSGVVDAVDCALKIQRSLEDKPELNLRIGIHVGDVVFEDDDISGEGVNVASQILNFAEPGSICVSERVYYGIQERPDIKTDFLGEKTLKNIEQPIKIYSLAGKALSADSTISSTAEQDSKQKPKPSIAVLPFVNLSADKEQEYFCDGMSEEIIYALTHVEGLRVVARTSAFSFRGKEIDVREIGSKLNVETLLEGSVRKAGKRLRITVQLVNIADGYHLWSGAYNRELEDVFAIQEEISLAIVKELKIKLLKKEKAAIAKRYTEDMEAYELYLMGRYNWNKRNEEAMWKGLDCFRQAIEKDPDYALAHTGIADSYNIMGFWSYISPKDSFPKAKASAGKALELDDTLAEAHASLAYASFCYDWDWSAAEKGFEKAITLNPGYAAAHYWYTNYLNSRGRFDEALAEIKRAHELDPLSLIIHFLIIDCFYLMGRYDEAVEQFNKAINIDPNFGLVYYKIGSVYRQQGKYKEAISALKKSIELTGGFSLAEGELGYIYGLISERDKAEQILQKLKEQKKEKYIPSSFISHIYSGLGENDRALEWMEKAFKERETMIPLLKVYPEFDNLRKDDRFKDLLKNIELE